MKTQILIYSPLAVLVFVLLVLKDQFNPQKRGVQKYTKNILKDYSLAKRVHDGLMMVHIPATSNCAIRVSEIDMSSL